tara:strand:- start:60 stop:560 length:501 start_codon:yes stop_codon:yes gene_type:complete
MKLCCFCKVDDYENVKQCSCYLHFKNNNTQFNWYNIKLDKCNYLDKMLEKGYIDVNPIVKAKYKVEFPRNTFIYLCEECAEQCEKITEEDFDYKEVYIQFEDYLDYYYIFSSHKFDRDEYRFVKKEDNKVYVYLKDTDNIMNILLPYKKEDILLKPRFELFSNIKV